MRTRRGNSYSVTGAPATNTQKRARLAKPRFNFFNNLPDDLILFILMKLSSSAACAADFFAALLTCKQFNELGLNPFVLAKASAEMFAVTANNWSAYVLRFLQRCADAGNAEALYTLGMIQFYCFRNRRTGATLMVKAAFKSHVPAMYSLAIIQFNGSGGPRHIRDLSSGAALCAFAAFHGHIDSMREFGYCLRDGFGVRQNFARGHQLLRQANFREVAAASANPSPVQIPGRRVTLRLILAENPNGELCSLGFNVPPPPRTHPANRFLVDWFVERPLEPYLRMCSYANCGRPETRVNEFRRCSACGVVSYCSRGCQARDWIMEHVRKCSPIVRFRIINVDD